MSSSSNATASTEIYTLSLHDALPICCGFGGVPQPRARAHAHHQRPAPACVGTDHRARRDQPAGEPGEDRKSTRLNSSHGYISYAVFCLKKKKKHKILVLD